MIQSSSIIRKNSANRVLTGLLILLNASCGGPSGPPPNAPPPHPNSPFRSTGTDIPKATPDNVSAQNNPPTKPPLDGTLITIEALGDVWILVQDAQGIELQWQNLRVGEQLPVNKRGAISITCSNGKAIRILDHKGATLEEAKKQEGIAILRLP